MDFTFRVSYIKRRVCIKINSRQRLPFVRSIVPQVLIRVFEGAFNGKGEVLHGSADLFKERKALARCRPFTIDAVDLDTMARGRDVQVPAG